MVLINRLKTEWYIIKEVLFEIRLDLDHDIKLKDSLSVMFGKRGRVRVNDGPWIPGSYYKYIRSKYFV